MTKTISKPSILTSNITLSNKETKLGQVTFDYILSTDNIADIFAKLLP